MKKIISMLLSLMLVLGLCACTQSDNEDKHLNRVDNGGTPSGVALKEQSVELEISPDSEGVQLSEEAILTNTKKITVTVSNISGDTEITCYLYASDNLEVAIGEVVLSADKKTADFENLTSSVSYKIGAEVSNSSDTVKLEITD